MKYIGKKYGFIFLLVVLVMMTAGCQEAEKKDTVNEQALIDKAEEMVVKAEGSGKALETELNFDYRSEQYSGNILSAPKLDLIAETNKNVTDAKAEINKVKDKEAKQGFLDRLAPVEKTSAEARLLIDVADQSSRYLEAKSNFVLASYNNPFSETLEADLKEFETTTKSLDENAKKLSDPQFYDFIFESYLADSEYINQQVKAILDARKGIEELDQLLNSKSDAEKTNAKSKELDELIMYIMDTKAQEALGRRHAEIMKSFVEY